MSKRTHGHRSRMDATDTRDRDQQILSRLARLEHKVDSIDQTTAFALRGDPEKHRETVKRIFGRSKRRAQVYLAADGHRNVQQIALHLGVIGQNVSRELKHLHDEGVLEIADSNGSENLWGKKAIDRTLNISKFLCEEYGLSMSGLPQAKKPANNGRKKRR